MYEKHMDITQRIFFHYFTEYSLYLCIYSFKDFVYKSRILAYSTRFWIFLCISPDNFCIFIYNLGYKSN